MENRKKIDWETVAAHYRAGRRSLRDIGGEFGISEGAIRKRAKKEGWPRDLSEQVKAKAADLVRKERVRNGAQNETEKELIAVEARMQADIIISHRDGISKKQELCSKLFDEISTLTGDDDLKEQLILSLGQGDMDGLAKAAQKVSSLPSRIKGFIDLVNAYKSLVVMESQAFGIEKGFNPDSESPSGFTITFHG